MAAAPKVKREGVRVQCIHNGHIVSEDSSKKINGAATPTAIVVIPGRGGRGARGVGPKHFFILEIPSWFVDSGVRKKLVTTHRGKNHR
jgi:hypothetical protein